MISSVLLLAFTTLAVADQIPLGGNDAPILRSQPASCPNARLSCHKGADISNTCCLNYPGGQFALTQFWNSDASKGPEGYLGPANSWTIHGLWPDHCDGSFDSNCDPSRNGVCGREGRHGHHECNPAYSNVGDVLNNFGASDLVEYMDVYWKGIGGDESLWMHEWAKHSTCVSTLEPECYGDDYKETEEVVDYFSKAVEIFQTLDTYRWLEAAGITPSNVVTYDLDNIVDALTAARVVSPIVACDHDELREAWYFFNVRGSVATGQFVPSDPQIAKQHMKGCPKTGIKYLPKEV